MKRPWKTKTLNQLELMDITYNRMWATKAAFGVVGPEADGCLVTNDFPIFRADVQRLLPGFIDLLFGQSSFQTWATALATGTTERRRLKEKDFLTIPILLPPLDEQRRIVDLIEAVDEAIEAAEQAARSFRSGISAIGEELIERSNLSPLSDLVSIEAPLVDPKQSQYAGMSYLDIEAIQSRTGVIRSLTTVGEAAPISAKFLFTSDDVIYSKIRPELRKVALPRTEGLCSADAYPLRARPRMLPEYLFEVLLTEGFSAEAVKKSGRTKMPKVNRGELLSIEVPAPDLATQQRVSRLLGSLRLAASGVAAYVTALVTLRSALLTDLLSGDHEIPASYDALLSA